MNARLQRRAVWVLAKYVGTTPRGEPIREYFTGNTGRHGGPARSPFRADAFKFYSARSAAECAQTHSDMRDSEEWRVLEDEDQTVVAARRNPSA